MKKRKKMVYIKINTTHFIYSYLAPNIWLRTTQIMREKTHCCFVVRAFAHGAMGCRIDPSWSGPIELFLVPASAPRLV